MTGKTHIAFASACTLAGAALSLWPASPMLWACTLVGALLPDLDTPKSLLGRPLWFIASPLEKWVGHRGLTHSFLGCLLYLLLALPLWLVHPAWAYALLGGVASHLAIDTLNVKGVPLLWPHPMRFIYRLHEAWAIEVGSTAEYILLAVLCLACLGLAPVAHIGGSTLWSRLLGDFSRALHQYERQEGQRELWLAGKLKDNTSEQRLEGRWRAIGTAGSSLLVLDGDAVRAVGHGEAHHLRPEHVVLEAGEPLQTTVTTLALSGQALSALKGHLPKSGEHWLFGELALAAPLTVPKTVGRYAVVRASNQTLTLDHARWRDLQALGHLLVTAGQVVLKHRGTHATALASPSEPASEVPTVVVPVTLDLHRLSDLHVKAGDTVAVGQPLAINGQVTAELTNLRDDIATERLALLQGVPEGFEQLYREGVIDRYEFLRFQAAKAKADVATRKLKAERQQLEAQQHVTSQLAGLVTSVQIKQQRGDTLTVELLIATPALPSIAQPAIVADAARRPTLRAALRPGTSDTGQGNTRIADFDAAKQVLPELFAGHEETLYCGCRYRGKKIDWHSYGFRPRQDRQRAARLEWEHVVPAAAFGRSFREWQSPPFECRGEDKRSCLRKLLPSFARMEADLYNLMPAIGEVNGRRSDAAMGKLWGERREFGACDVEIRGGTIEPRPSIRGDIARTYFYMAWAYPGRLQLSRRQRRLLEAWAAADPPDAWEQERARRIERVQGNRNPFISGGPAADTALRAAAR